MCKYLVNQFVIVEVDDGLVVQNKNGVTLLKNEGLIELFKELDNDNRLKINKLYIERFVDSDEVENAISFMIDNGLIDLEKEFKHFEKMHIITNNDVLYRSLKFNTSEILDKVSSYYFDSSALIANELVNIEYQENDFVMIALIPFDYIDFINICDILIKKNMLFSVCFSYNSSIYVSNLYKKDWHNPCPKCFFSHLESSLRAYQKNTTNISFQTVVDLLYSNNVRFNPNVPLQIYNILKLVAYFIDMLSDDINLLANRIVRFYDDNKECEFDQAIHWELCNCFEE